jgi:hypothetical protein
MSAACAERVGIMRLILICREARGVGTTKYWVNKKTCVVELSYPGHLSAFVLLSHYY